MQAGRVTYKVGDLVELWSKSQQAWVRGSVDKVEGQLIHVAYVGKEGLPTTKTMPNGHEELRTPGEATSQDGPVADIGVSSCPRYRRQFEIFGLTVAILYFLIDVIFNLSKIITSRWKYQWIFAGGVSYGVLFLVVLAAMNIAAMMYFIWAPHKYRQSPDTFLICRMI